MVSRRWGEFTETIPRQPPQHQRSTADRPELVRCEPRCRGLWTGASARPVPRSVAPDGTRTAVIAGLTRPTSVVIGATRSATRRIQSRKESACPLSARCCPPNPPAPVAKYHGAAVAREEESRDSLGATRELHGATLDAVDVDANLRRPAGAVGTLALAAVALAHHWIVRVLGEPDERRGEQLIDAAIAGRCKDDRLAVGRKGSRSKERRARRRSVHPAAWCADPVAGICC